jgi:hypothetical protein
MVVGTCHLNYAGGINWRVMVQATLGIKPDPVSEITNTKGLRGVAQVVQHRLSKQETLGSTPNTTEWGAGNTGN